MSKKQGPICHKCFKRFEPIETVYDSDGTGPYCNACWEALLAPHALRARIIVLGAEKQAAWGTDRIKLGQENVRIRKERDDARDEIERLRECGYARKYKGIQRPTCWRTKCRDIYIERAKEEQS